MNFAALFAAAEAGEVAAVRRLAAARPDRINFYFMENAHVDPARLYDTARLLLEKLVEVTTRAAPPNVDTASNDHYRTALFLIANHL